MLLFYFQNSILRNIDTDLFYLMMDGRVQSHKALSQSRLSIYARFIRQETILTRGSPIKEVEMM